MGESPAGPSKALHKPLSFSEPQTNNRMAWKRRISFSPYGSEAMSRASGNWKGVRQWESRFYGLCVLTVLPEVRTVHSVRTSGFPCDIETLSIS